MNSYLLVFLGAGLGGAARHGVNLAAARLFGSGFPWGTLTVNAVGGLLMGLVAGWLAHKAGESWTHGTRLFLTTGVLGGFTTFSAFSLDALLLHERGQTGPALAYVAASVVLAIGALWVGLMLMRGAA